ncbi:hypothetical protein HPB47_023355 [Ixodes persulcatus]|uniref:Uncharacterized protein n=1 Tax=Ixodes persulcatus TaxID=34615 RepID=A0AC60Q9I8_IXOPE|nr:hypothetical protein HPB47_023355 [Ixodes persulcatus]
MLYPKPGAVSEAMAYGREYEPDAVASYVQLLMLADIEVEVRETGLHLHPQYNFIGASPDRIVTVAGDEGLLEVKCPLSQKGKTDHEGCSASTSTRSHDEVLTPCNVVDDDVNVDVLKLSGRLRDVELRHVDNDVDELTPSILMTSH